MPGGDWLAYGTDGRPKERTMLTIPGLLIILAFAFAVLSLMGRMTAAVPVFVLALERLYSVVMIGLIR